VPPPPAPPDEGDRLARAFTVDCERPNSLAKLARYEGSIQRSIDRSLRQLTAFQAARITLDASPRPDPGPAAEAPEAPQTKPQPTPDPAPAPPKHVDYEPNPKNGGIAPVTQARYPLGSSGSDIPKAPPAWPGGSRIFLAPCSKQPL
jgi:hypothetical protein